MDHLSSRLLFRLPFCSVVLPSAYSGMCVSPPDKVQRSEKSSSTSTRKNASYHWYWIDQTCYAIVTYNFNQQAKMHWKLSSDILERCGQHWICALCGTGSWLLHPTQENVILVFASFIFTLIWSMKCDWGMVLSTIFNTYKECVVLRRVCAVCSNLVPTFSPKQEANQLTGWDRRA